MRSQIFLNADFDMDEDNTSQVPRQAGDLYSSEQPVREFAEAVFVRPKMYTIGGT